VKSTLAEIINSIQSSTELSRSSEINITFCWLSWYDFL